MAMISFSQYLIESSGSREFKLGHTTITYGVHPNNGTAEIILVKTPKQHRGEGSARKAMNALLAQLDSENKTVFLNAQPMDKGVTQGKLESFYKSLGFRKNTGSKKDFRSQCGWVRDPK